MMLIIQKGLKQAKKQRDVEEWEAGKPHEGYSPKPGDVEKAMEKEKKAIEGQQSITAPVFDNKQMAAARGVDQRTYQPPKGTPSISLDGGGRGSQTKKSSTSEATNMLKGKGKGKDCGDEAMMDKMIAKAKETAEKAYLGEVKFGSDGPKLTGGAKQSEGQHPASAGGPNAFSPFATAGEKANAPKPAKAAAASGGSDKGVMTSAPKEGGAKPPPIPADAKSMTKSAVEILKASGAASGNPQKEQGPVSGFNMGGKDRAETDCGCDDDEKHAGKGPAQQSVSGTPHAGSGPAQQSVSGTPHAGSGPAQTNVKGRANPAREGGLNKAVTAMAMPRMPRAMAMAMDTWRSATRVLSRNNLDVEKNIAHAGAGPLNAETIQTVEDASQERASRIPIEMTKSCNGCGRTYTLRKGQDSWQSF
jgi:hypothetical protein